MILRLSLVPLGLLLPVVWAAAEPDFSPGGTFGGEDLLTAAARLADLDSDGDLDIVMVNGRHWERQDVVLLNDGNGVFSKRTLGSPATGYAPAIADLDGDGHLDIAIARDRVASVRFMGNGADGFSAAIEIGIVGPARSVNAADMNGDGHPDLVFCLRSEPNYIALGPEFETFLRFGGDEQSVRSAVADFDGDGDLDIVVANLDGGRSAVYRNDGVAGMSDAEFLDVAPAVDVAVADFNGDGRPDAAFAAVGQSRVFFNDREGRLSRSVTLGPDDERSYAIAAGDLDGDGEPDIAVANDGQENAIYVVNDGRFERMVINTDAEARSYDVSIGDVNGDGIADLVFANSGSNSRIHLGRMTH